MHNLWQDLRYAFRVLAKSPGFSSVAILTLALGIGANVAAFSVVRAILLEPMPFPHPGQLVRVFDDLRTSNVHDVGMSAPECMDLERSAIFQEISPVWAINANLTGLEKPERIEALATGTNYFTLLGAKPRLGRVFTSDDKAPGFIEPTVISDGFWRREFGADPGVLGKRIRLDGDLYTIVGVMPPDFRHPGRTLQTDVDLWIAAGYVAAPFPDPPVRAFRFFPAAIARLKPGVSLASAQSQLDAFASHLSAQYPSDYPAAVGWGLRLVSIQDDLVGPVRAELFALFAAVGCVLLIACVNIANLLLARGAGRQREVAIRLSLGASRGRLVAQLLTESLLLAAVAGLVAIIAVAVFRQSLLALAPADFPRLAEVRVNAGVLYFAFFLSLFTALQFGLVPALRAANPNLVEKLREGSLGSGSGKSHIRISRILVASEIALSLILLIAGGLVLRSFWRILQTDPGFRPDGVISAQFWMPVPNDPTTDPYRSIDKRSAFYREVLRRVSAIPGVAEAAIASENSLPMSRARNRFPFLIEGRPADSEHLPVAEFASVSPEYFSTLGIPVLAGRGFQAADDYNTLRVALIDRTLADRYWPGEDPVGKRIRPGPANVDAPWATIVGVVASIKSDGLDLPTAPHIWFTVFQNPPASGVIYARTSMNPESLQDAIRREVQSVDPGIPVFAVRTLTATLARSLADRRFALTVLASFAAIALVLASLGIYGVMSYIFSRRTHEFAIRIALGALPADILRMALGEGMILVAFGLAAGLLGALAATRYLRALLFTVDPADPLTFALLSLFLAGVALLACFIPAQRATRVDPLSALREE